MPELISVEILADIGPTLGRPRVDTLKNSKLSNLKELRVQSNGRPFRIIFLFDRSRNAILLTAGNKEGKKRFYDTIIPEAEKIYQKFLKEQENG